MNPLGDARQKFKIQYFLVGILFIIFDLEIIFLFPYATILYESSFLAVWCMNIFLFVLTIGFIYEYTKGALKWVN